jgi:hypothetical protein
MTTQQIADRLVALCRTGQNQQAYQELFSQDAVAIEPDMVADFGGAPETKGLPALLAKSANFQNMLEAYHSGSISEPLVAGNFFSVKMAMDVTYKEMGRRQEEEICVYEVRDGKIVREQFFF